MCARLESQAVAGYYPAPAPVLAPIAALIDVRPAWQRVRDDRTERLVWPQIAALDPCAGDGAALRGFLHALLGPRWPALGSGPELRLYAAELEAARAGALEYSFRDDRPPGGSAQALHADAFQLACPTTPAAPGLDLLWLNPPYEFSRTYGRLEEAFLQRFTPTLRPGAGLLIFLIPGHALAASATTLAAEYDVIHAYRFPDDEYAAYKQIVVLARRRGEALLLPGATDAEAATLRAWAADPLTLPVLPAPGAVAPVLALAPVAHGGLAEFRAQPLDLTRLLPHLRAGTSGGSDWATPPPPAAPSAGGKRGPRPTEAWGLHQDYPAFLSRRQGIAQPPRPTHTAMMLAAGMLNGLRCDPDDPASGFPPLLIKGIFVKERKTIDTKVNKDGAVTGVVQVQQPRLRLTVLALPPDEPPYYHELAAGTRPSGATTVRAMNAADLLTHYGQSLAALIAQQFPPLHDPRNHDGLIPLPATGRTPFTAQAHTVQTLLKLLAQGRNPFLDGEVGSGKCLGPETHVTANGVVQTLEEIWTQYAEAPLADGDGEIALPNAPLLVPSYDEATGQVEQRLVGGLWRQRVREPLRTVRLVDGRAIRVTRAHRFLTPQGWTNAITPGSYVAIPRREPGLPTAGPSPLDPRFMAWMIGEGCEVWFKNRAGINSTARLTITQKDRQVLDSLIPAAQVLGMTHIQVHAERNSHDAPELTAVATPAIRRLAQHGYTWGYRSAAKRVPECIMQADQESARTFLSAYMAAEGSVSTVGAAMEISTASEGMAHDLCTLLRRFGIYSRIRSRIIAGPTSGIKRRYYRVHISGSAIRRFGEQIGCEAPAKAERLTRWAQVGGDDNLETVYVADLLHEAKRITGLGAHSSRNLFTTHNLRGDQPTVNAAMAERLIGFLETTGTAEALALAATVRHRVQSEVFFVKVKAVEETAYEGWVYDLHVPGPQNFVANHILVHNTFLALLTAWALGPEHFATTTAALAKLGLADPTGRLRPVKNLLVLVPPHLRTSWTDQVQAVLPGAHPVVVESVADLQRPPPPPGTGPGAGLTVYILSRERAKLGPQIRAALVRARPGGPVRCCPRCGTPVDGELTAEIIVAEHHRCAHATLEPHNGLGRLAQRLAELLLPCYPADKALRQYVPGRILPRAVLRRATPAPGDPAPADDAAPAGDDDAAPDPPAEAADPADAAPAAGDDPGPAAAPTDWATGVLAPDGAGPLRLTNLVRALAVAALAQYQHDPGGPATPRLDRTLTALTALLVALPEPLAAALVPDVVRRLYTATLAYPAPLVDLPPEDDEPTPRRTGSAAARVRALVATLLLVPDATATALRAELRAAGCADDPSWAGWDRTRDQLRSDDADRASLARGLARHLLRSTPVPGAWPGWRHDLDTGALTYAQAPVASAAAARAALAGLVRLGAFHAQVCGEPLFTQAPNPRRHPLARWIARYSARHFDLVVLDEAHEYNNVGSAQEQAAAYLSNLPRTPVLAMSGSLMGGYASSLFANFRNLCRDFAAEFGRDDKGLFVNRFGYWKLLVSYTDDGRERKVVAYGAQSLRREEEEDGMIRTLGEAPGVMPLFLPRYLLPNTAFIHKTDLDVELPPYDEQPLSLAVAADDHDGQTLLHEYETVQDALLAAIKADQFTPNQGKLWGAMNQLGSFLDLATADVGNTLVGGRPAYEVRYPPSAGKRLVVRATLLPASTILPKERWMLDELRAQLARGRNVILFVARTGNARLLARYQRLIRQEAGVEAIYLDTNKVDTEHREVWIRQQVIACRRRVLLVNAEGVKTGLNCLTPYFKTAIWLGLTDKTLTYRQANGRVHRIGSDPAHPVEVRVPVYAATAQEAQLGLLARKATASGQIDGLDLESALEAAGAADDEDSEAAARAATSMGRAIYEVLVGAAPSHHEWATVPVAAPTPYIPRPLPALRPVAPAPALPAPVAPVAPLPFPTLPGAPRPLPLPALPGTPRPRPLPAATPRPALTPPGAAVQLSLFDTPAPAPAPKAARARPAAAGTFRQTTLFDLLDDAA